MPITCNRENCTVVETGKCLLNNPPESCPHRQSAEDGKITPGSEPPLAQPERNPKLPHSLTLTPTQTKELMAGRYCTLVGILGDPDAGKTAALVSLYLLVSRSKLNGFSFSDSRTLMAFNEISQGALEWNEGQLPDQLTQHTELVDDRTAGFLHLRLRPSVEQAAIDFLLPDLPGEWSKSIVDKNRVDRLQFLKRADVIWLMMDGSQLCEPSQRHWAVHRMNLLLERVVECVGTPPPVILVLTRRDRSEVPASAFEPLVEEARQRNIDLSVIQIASFADQGPVLPGFGIDVLVQASRSKTGDDAQWWPSWNGSNNGNRAMLRYRIPEQGI